MMDERTLQASLRARPPADPVYRSRLTDQPGVVRDLGVARDPGVARDLVTTTRIRTRGRTRSMFSAARLVAAIAIVSLGSGALLLTADQGPSPVPAASPSPTPAQEDPRIAGDGPWLEWEKLDDSGLQQPYPCTLPDPPEPPFFDVDTGLRRGHFLRWWGDRIVAYHWEPGSATRHLSLLGPDGSFEDMPFSEEALALVEFHTRGSVDPTDGDFAAGGLGIVLVDFVADRVLFSPDAVRWSVAPTPADWGALEWRECPVTVGADDVLTRGYRGTISGVTPGSPLVSETVAP